MKTSKTLIKDKNENKDFKKSKQSNLTLEIAETLKEVKQIHEGKINALSLKDI
jgi:hypothetical protein